MADLLKSIQIENFCGFHKPKTIEIAAPNGAIGSGLTIFVGENNSGKSSIFEAIKKLKNNSHFRPKERHRGHNPKIIFTDRNDKSTQVTRAKRSTANVETDQGGSITVDIFEIIPSRRQWQSTFSAKSLNTYQDYLNQSFSLDSRSNSIDSHFGSLLEKIAEEPPVKENFNDILSRMIPNFLDWEIDTDNDGRDYVKYQTSSNLYHDTSLVGDGVISLFRICAHLVSTTSNLILCIDEPELSLSPRAQRILAREFAIAAKDKQILLTTHCPHFVNWPDLVNGAKLYRVSKNSNGTCQLYGLNTHSPSFSQLSRSFEDWQKPHILDAVAKEFFFSDRVLFLEGQEDVGLIRRFIHHEGIPINFDIFGYGAGGSGNIPALLSIAKELGIQAGALFDKNAPGLELANTQFSSEFKIKELQFDDVRIKKDRPTKTGLFESDGSISEMNSTALKQILGEFIEFFKSHS